jgi:hypothetical protein
MITASEAVHCVEVDSVAAGSGNDVVRCLQCGPVIAGTFVAASLTLVLVAFGSAIGLAIISSSPSWRDTSPVLTALSGLYLLITAFVSFGLGGYLAGHLRTNWGPAISRDEIEFRNGVLAWAIAVVGSIALVAASAAGVASKVGPTSLASATTSEPLLTYQLDRPSQSKPPRAIPDLAYHRAEAGRILLTAAGRRGVTPADRAYLVQLVAGETGLAPPAAERRVDNAIIDAKTAVKKARKGAATLGFSTAASLLLGAAVAWGAAAIGGRHRDDVAPPYSWRWPRPLHSR